MRCWTPTHWCVATRSDPLHEKQTFTENRQRLFATLRIRVTNHVGNLLPFSVMTEGPSIGGVMNNDEINRLQAQIDALQ
ncbi:MAG: hypothetical protein RL726_1996, partial [Actinomycetota bacterium]